ncbi:MAG: hypothetical protein WBN75_06410, partial [Verrucomicrobiia bacterium]
MPRKSPARPVPIRPLSHPDMTRLQPGPSKIQTSYPFFYFILAPEKWKVSYFIMWGSFLLWTHRA